MSNVGVPPRVACCVRTGSFLNRAVRAPASLGSIDASFHGLFKRVFQQSCHFFVFDIKSSNEIKLLISNQSLGGKSSSHEQQQHNSTTAPHNGDWSFKVTGPWTKNYQSIDNTTISVSARQYCVII